MKYKYLNLKYAAINATFMLMVCATSGYAYNFLSQSGFADGAIGIIIALVSICGLVGQTISGSIIDKSDKIDEKTFISGAMICTVVLSLLLAVIPAGSFLMIPVVILAFTAAAIGLPFFNSMAFIYEKDGQKINYGLGRGTGSAAYAAGSALLGTLWGWKGRTILPFYIAFFAVATFLLVRLMPTPSKAAEEAGEAEEKAVNLSYGEFFRKYSRIILVVVSMILMYFCHMIIQTYFAKVITNIIGEEAASVSGAVESIQGTALFIQAMVELPTMFLFSQILKKVSINIIMVFAAVMFSVKHVMTWLCSSTGMLYGAMVLQMLGYALIVPGGVYLANEIVQPEDRNKGQAVMGVTMTIGGLLSSSIGGQLYQWMSVSNVVLVGVIASVIGTILMFIGIRQIESN